MYFRTSTLGLTSRLSTYFCRLLYPAQRPAKTAQRDHLFRFSLLKTLPMTTEANCPSRCYCLRSLPMAGVEVTTCGRFWVTAKACFYGNEVRKLSAIFSTAAPMRALPAGRYFSAQGILWRGGIPPRGEFSIVRQFAVASFDQALKGKRIPCRIRGRAHSQRHPLRLAILTCINPKKEPPL